LERKFEKAIQRGETDEAVRKRREYGRTHGYEDGGFMDLYTQALEELPGEVIRIREEEEGRRQQRIKREERRKEELRGFVIRCMAADREGILSWAEPLFEEQKKLRDAAIKGTQDRWLKEIARRVEEAVQTGRLDKA
jgi:hypothetical protein